MKHAARVHRQATSRVGQQGEKEGEKSARGKGVEPRKKAPPKPALMEWSLLGYGLTQKGDKDVEQGKSSLGARNSKGAERTGDCG